jgi:hypothetical protein
VRTPPEELVNSASAAAPCSPVYKRSQVNQPDLAFPQSPGIILKRTAAILLAAARFVLSMNCKQYNTAFRPAYNLICTVYPPKTPREQGVNKSNPAMK